MRIDAHDCDRCDFAYSTEVNLMYLQLIIIKCWKMLLTNLKVDVENAILHINLVCSVIL